LGQLQQLHYSREEHIVEPTKTITLDTCAVAHRRQFLATARRILRDPVAAQDAVQEAMLSAARNLQRFRGESQLSTGWAASWSTRR
jgi:DNA-directed RNA polymerase specialized sigma24 family protein